jgi:hypothetical protein
MPFQESSSSAGVKAQAVGLSQTIDFGVPPFVEATKKTYIIYILSIYIIYIMCRFGAFSGSQL